MPLNTFSIHTLGCKVNQYEGEQLAALLRSRGLTPAAAGQPADLRVVHTCSVTVQAASKSRQAVRRAAAGSGTCLSLPVLPSNAAPSNDDAGQLATTSETIGRRVLVTGCWATSDPAAARALPGVDAVLTHHDDVAGDLDRLLAQWRSSPGEISAHAGAAQHGEIPEEPHSPNVEQHAGQNASPEPMRDNRWNDSAGTPTGILTPLSKPTSRAGVNEKIGRNATFASHDGRAATAATGGGMTTLPLLDDRQAGRQRAVLKIQDGCDAHCTYCIIPRLRPRLWSKPVEHAVEEAARLVETGHVELVLTGIFLSAYGQQTALRRRQPPPQTRASGRTPLADLIEALCTRVPGLRRLRLSSLEPGDLTDDLLATLRSHRQVVPHFHLPLQSGSDAILRRMNRQYGRDDFLRMVDRVRAAFDRPALTTDVIAGFPGETDQSFRETADVVERAGFIHVHAFHFSPRPGTAAARWSKDFVHGPVVNERIEVLRSLANRASLAFRQSFVGQEVELLVEHEKDGGVGTFDASPVRHGRSERYFDVTFEDASARPGDFVRVRITRVTTTRTHGVRC